MIAQGDPDWNQLRTMAHTAEKWLDSPKRCYACPMEMKFTTQVYSSLLRLYRGKLSAETLLLLTEGVNRLTIKEQAIQDPVELCETGSD